MNERSVSALERFPGGADQTDAPSPLRVALVGTYPPTRCGIATFTASLRAALEQAGAASVDVVRVLDAGEAGDSPPEVVFAFRPDDPIGVRRAATVLSGYDAVVVQHEFGIYGPGSGRAAVDLIESVTVPVTVTLHTVTEEFSPEEQRIVEALASRAAFVVTLSDTAAQLLVSRYGVDPSGVRVIPHGTRMEDETACELPVAVDDPAGLLLTWGLIGPGKGLDWAVGALPLVREQIPTVHWVVAGETHPKVAAREGERYRRELQTAIGQLGVERNVTLIDAYLTRGQIHRLLREAAAVVLPYDSTQQTSSGVLVEAVTATVPVVATAFPQAVEIARKGGALVVPHRDVDALASALIRVLTDTAVSTRMVEAQRSMARAADWAEVATAYLELMESPVTAIAS